MGSPRNVCHRCRHKWKVKGWAEECPKCGHTNVGPTDPARGIAGPIAIVLVLVVAGAWYLGYVPDEAKKAVESTVEGVRKEVERHVPKGEAETQPRIKPKPGNPPGTPQPPSPPPPPPPPPAGTTPEPKGDAVKIPLPEIVVSSKSGAATSNTYFVKGKVTNTGGADASRVKVLVTFRDAAGKKLSTVEARCKTELAAGKKAKFEAAVAGEQAERVDGFTVEATWKR